MPTSLEVLTNFVAPLQVIRGMMTDPGYITIRAEQTGATSVKVDVDTDEAGDTLLTIVRVVPAQLPSFAASLVGPTLEITERQAWGGIDDGRCTSTFEVTFSAPITATGSISLIEAAGVTSAHTSGHIKSTVPFVGGKVEKVALEQMELYLNKEVAIAQAWLSR